MTPNDDTHLDQHCLRLRLGAVRQQAIIWSNVNKVYLVYIAVKFQENAWHITFETSIKKFIFLGSPGGQRVEWWCHRWEPKILTKHYTLHFPSLYPCRNKKTVRPKLSKSTLIARFVGQYGANPGPTGPRWSPCWPHEHWYLCSEVWCII